MSTLFIFVAILFIALLFILFAILIATVSAQRKNIKIQENTIRNLKKTLGIQQELEEKQNKKIEYLELTVKIQKETIDTLRETAAMR
ncbi:MAG: hypothetical protein AAB861_02335 [Patescibacteria group bacterium]